jgi:hypothetical protein
VRRHIQSIAKPGILLADMCETLENSVRALIEERGLDAGALPLRGAGSVCLRAGVRVCVWGGHASGQARQQQPGGADGRAGLSCSSL